MTTAELAARIASLDAKDRVAFEKHREDMQRSTGDETPLLRDDEVPQQDCFSSCV